MRWFPNFGFQRRKRELQEEIDAHLQMAIVDRVVLQFVVVLLAYPETKGQTLEQLQLRLVKA